MVYLLNRIMESGSNPRKLNEQKTRLILEEAFSLFHHRDYLKPDPLQFLYQYTKIQDREIVGLLASSLALGRINAIVKTIEKVFQKLPSPTIT